MYFPGVCIFGQDGQWHIINQQLLEVVIGLRLYGVVCCLRIPDYIAEGNSLLTNNCLRVVLEFPVPSNPVLVPF